MDLSREGFAIENEWFWKLTEGAQTFDAVAAVRDFLAPLARHAKGKLAITEIASEVDEVRFQIDEVEHSIRIYAGSTDRVSVNHFVSDIDHVLQAARTGYHFVLVTPRRYELRGVLLTDEQWHSLASNPVVFIPTQRTLWRGVT